MINHVDNMLSLIKNDTKQFKGIEKDLKLLKIYLISNDYGKSLKIINNLLNNKYVSRLSINNKLLNDLKADTDKEFRDYKLAYDTTFKDDCLKSNLIPVTGDIVRGYRIKGIIQIKIDFENSLCLIGTDFRKIKLKTVKINDIVSEIINLMKLLFDRPLNLNTFIDELYLAYVKVAGNRFDKEVLLADIQKEIWISKQKESFWLSYNKNNIIDYFTDDFSIDIYKLIKNRYLLTSNGYKLLLSEGPKGIVVYDETGKFKTYKFVKFSK